MSMKQYEPLWTGYLIVIQAIMGFFQFIEFVDIGSSGFLSDLYLVVASYNDIFINRPRTHDIQQWWVYLIYFHS